MTGSRHTGRFGRADGFTLIELLVVIAIIALLVSIILPAFGAAKRHAQNAATNARIQTLGAAASQYFMNTQSRYYPGGDRASLQQLADGNFTGSQILAMRLLGLDDSGNSIDGAGLVSEGEIQLAEVTDRNGTEREGTLMDAFREPQPILYFPARRMFSRTLEVYRHQDNPYRGWNPSDNEFRDLIERDPDRPVNPQTFLLMARGLDGRFGTDDDNRNYQLDDD